MMKNLKKQNGITLIALVITIIVLLILAGITIGALTGENGILKNTELARIETRGASVQEARDIWFAEIYLAEITGGTAKSMDEILQDLLDQEMLTQEEVEQIKASENNEITIGSRTISFKTDYVLEKEEQIMIAELSSSNITENGFTLNVEVRDQESGVNKIIWYYKLSTEDNYTSITDTFTATTSAITTAKEITQLSAGTYNAYAVIYDEAGNTKQTGTINVPVVGPLAKNVQIGDYVAYDATNSYSYESPVGTGPSHGNGYSAQTFTSSSSIKWRVLSTNTGTGEVVLISDAPILTNAGENFYLYGAIGYLYGEEELNRICAIYGHGVGANTSKSFTYQTGDEIEGYATGTLTGSGARNINVDDINSICGVTPSSSIFSDYGTKPYTTSMIYPTKTTTTGYSTTARISSYTHTYYEYTGSTYLSTDSVMYKMLFRDVTNSSNIYYWLSSRAVSSSTGRAYFYVRSVRDGSVHSYGVYGGYSSDVVEYNHNSGVRPLVYLKTTLQTSGKDASGAWTIIDN